VDLFGQGIIGFLEKSLAKTRYLKKAVFAHFFLKSAAGLNQLTLLILSVE
jgi:hypothetical protein